MLPKLPLLTNTRPDRPTTAAVLVAGTLLAAVLVNCGPGPDKQPMVWETIHEAVAKGDLADLKRHLARGADVNERGFGGRTPLHFAAVVGYTNVAELLITKGADVNAKDDDNSPPLIEAAAGGYADVAKLLIAKGADVNAKNQNGATPLHLAAIMGHKHTVELLVTKGAGVNARDRNGMTPLHWVKRGHRAWVKRGHNTIFGLSGDTILFSGEALEHSQALGAAAV